MAYINCLELVNKLVESNFFYIVEDKITLFRNSFENKEEGWFFKSKDEMAKDLMEDEDSRLYFLFKLKQKGIDFKTIFN